MNDKKKRLPQACDQEPSQFLAMVDMSPAIPKNELVLGELVKLPDGKGYGVLLNGQTEPTPCLSTVSLTDEHLHRKAALMFLQGSGAHPVVLGFLADSQNQAPKEVLVDQQRVTIEGQKEIELRCGKASIVMKANGKIIIKGTHLISRSAGPNKIKGASISLN